MCILSCKHPEVFHQFSQGTFSSVALDHMHEQANASVKGDGGAVGLTDNAGALL